MKRLPPKLAKFRARLELAQVLAWERKSPDSPGFWLSLYWDHGRRFVDRWDIKESMHLPVKMKPDWLWFGPIRLPEKDTT